MTNSPLSGTSSFPPSPPPPPADPEALRPLKVLATKWHIAFGAMLSLGLVLQTLM